MENKKYEFTGETMEWKGRTLHRIRAVRDFGLVKKGALGGWIEDGKNLSHNGNCWVFDKSKVYDNATLRSEAMVRGEAIICCDALVLDNAAVCGEAIVCGNAIVRGYAIVCGNAAVCGEAIVRGNARISSDNDIFLVGPIGSRQDYTTFYKGSDGKIMVTCGCFRGDIEKFEKKVQEVHKGTKYEKEYKVAIELAKIHISLKGE